jgi:hypothetical protein
MPLRRWHGKPSFHDRNGYSKEEAILSAKHYATLFKNPYIVYFLKHEPTLSPPDRYHYISKDKTTETWYLDGEPFMTIEHKPVFCTEEV